jgi:hypothetical protein
MPKRKVTQLKRSESPRDEEFELLLRRAAAKLKTAKAPRAAKKETAA